MGFYYTSTTLIDNPYGLELNNLSQLFLLCKANNKFEAGLELIYILNVISRAATPMFADEDISFCSESPSLAYLLPAMEYENIEYEHHTFIAIHKLAAPNFYWKKRSLR